MKNSEQLLVALIDNAPGKRDEILNGTLDVRRLPIPAVKLKQTAGAYKNIATANNLHHGKLVELSDYGFTATKDYYSSEAALNPVYGKNFPAAPKQVLFLDSLVPALQAVNSCLKQHYHVELEAMNAYRPKEVQDEIYNAFYVDGLNKHSRTLSGNQLKSEAHRHAATYASRAPEEVSLEDPCTWYTHGTGASIDVLLRETYSGNRLEFGVIFDDPCELSHSTAFENKATSITHRAIRTARRILFWTMAAGGFVNYPEEFFHFDPFCVNGRVSQFGILNAQSWGARTAGILANIPPAQEFEVPTTEYISVKPTAATSLKAGRP